MKTLISYEQLEFDVEELQAFRDRMTKEVQELLAIIDDSDAFEKYPGLLTAMERIEALL
jgi:hypothetical protein